jgi:hypothetical protein
MHAWAAFPANGEAFELVKVADGLFNDQADAPEPDDLLLASLRDCGCDPFGAQPLTQGSGVVAAVGQDHVESAADPSDSAGHRRDGVDQVEPSLDVGLIPTGGVYCERIPVESWAA